LLVLIEYDDHILREESEKTKCDIYTPDEQNYIYSCMYLTLFSKDINNEKCRSSAFFLNIIERCMGKCASKFLRKKKGRESSNVKKMLSVFYFGGFNV